MPHGREEQGARTNVLWKRTRHHRSRLRRWTLMGMLALWGIWGWGAGDGSALSIEYFAVGDSVASGYGLADDATACRQSMLAYPWLVFEVCRGPLSWANSTSWRAQAPRRKPSGACFHPNRAGAQCYAETGGARPARPGAALAAMHD